MQHLQDAKSLVLSHYDALDAAPEAGLAEALSRHCSADCAFQFVHPFNDVTGPEAAAERFWHPLRQSFAPLQRRQDVFMAGDNALDDGATTWVVSMGHLLGLFDAPFLGLRPTRHGTMLRYAEFFRVEGGRITDVTLFLDMLNLMHLVRAECLPEATGPVMVTPGPRTHGGLMFDAQDPSAGQDTLALFQRMINRLLGTDVHTLKSDLVLDWTEDMIWWGPGGIGAPYTQGRYLEQHTGPFEDGLTWGTFFGHRMEIGEGHFGGFFGWPTFDVISKGGYIGLAPASDTPATMRVVDIYRREGDLLAENWNFIDQLHFLDQLGVDLVARQKMLTGY